MTRKMTRIAFMLSAITFLTTQTTTAADATKGKILRHVVLFSFKKESSKDDVNKIVTAFGKLKDQIKQIKDYEWGTDVSPEKRADGFTHCFIITFESAEDRDAYLPHPAHQKFAKLVGPHLEKVLVVDFWAQN